MRKNIPVCLVLATLLLAGPSLLAAAPAASASPAPAVLTQGTAPASASPSTSPSAAAVIPSVAPAKPAPMADLGAWDAVALMAPGVNIGNTLENTTKWETGWGNPLITREFVENLASQGFRTVRLPVAWDTYAKGGVIQEDKFQRVEQVVDWILGAGMFCVLNIHWDGGWIDSSWKEKFPDDFATFSETARVKFPSYWNQIATRFRDKNEHLIFEGLNEETNFSNQGSGSTAEAYNTLTEVNQLFVDTVRKTGGNNARRLLVVTGYSTDIAKTCSSWYAMPEDTVKGKLFISVHYYTPWQFCGMTKDESWGKMMTTWGSQADKRQLEGLFDDMARFCKTNDCPAFIGEFGVDGSKESASRVRWMDAVIKGAIKRKMVPVLWDTGGDVRRKEPYGVSKELAEVLSKIGK